MSLWDDLKNIQENLSGIDDDLNKIIRKLEDIDLMDSNEFVSSEIGSIVADITQVKYQLY